jgi:hypothetical protein
METEVWFRNPVAYIREVAEVRHPLLLWDRGLLVKRSVDPVKQAKLYMPADVHFRIIIVGDSEQGAMEVTRQHSESAPAAVYPVWSYGEEMTVLEELMASSVGEDPAACSDESVPRHERPVLGQEHRVVISDLPYANTGPGRKFLRVLNDLQVDYPDCIVHLHGSYSWRVMFGHEYRSVDVDPRVLASKGDVMLPNGKYMSFERAAKFPQWVTVLGYKPVDLSVPRNRCMYNMHSALWAARHFKENLPFKSTGKVEVDTTVSDAQVAVPVIKSRSPHRGGAQDGDKFLCNTCTLQAECKYYREGAVCSVPDSEPMSLAKLFHTRDSDSIIEGLSTLLGAQANRLERGMTEEDFGDELDPHVTSLINSLFNNGVKLAKLVDPKLKGGTQVGVFVNGGQASVAQGGSANQLMAAVVAELEAKGIARQDITPEMIGQVLDPNARTQAAIETTAVVESERDK